MTNGELKDGLRALVYVAALAAVIALTGVLTGCEGYVDPQLVEDRTDGGIVAVQQAVVTPPPSPTLAKEDFRIIHLTQGYEYNDWVILQATGNSTLWDYINPSFGSGVAVIWAYKMGATGSWQLTGWPATDASRTGGEIVTVATEGKTCWPLGCMGVQVGMQKSSIYHHERSIDRGWLPPGVDPASPHPHVFLRRCYLHRCRAGGAPATAPIWCSNEWDLTAAPDTFTTNVGTANGGPGFDNEAAKGLFNDPTAWSIIAHQCGDYPQNNWDAFGNNIYIRCGCGAAGDTYGIGGSARTLMPWCFGWPNAASCTAGDAAKQECARRCGGQ